MSTLVLDATTKTITAVMSGAAATNNPEFTAAWADSSSSGLTEGASDGALNGTSLVTLVAAPAASTRRVIKWITIQNKDTAPVTVTISYANSSGSTSRQIAKVTLAVNDTWTTDGTFDSAGNLKTSAVGTLSNALTMNNGGSGDASGTTFNGSVARTISYNTIGAAATGAANTFTAAQTFRAANAVRSEAASTQDAIVLAGRAGGTSSYAVTLTPATLSASRTVTLPDGGGNYTLGYLNVPQSGSDKTTSYSLATTDVGKFVGVGTSGSITIPDATFAAGDVISLFNNTTGNITITCTITTAYIAGTDADKATMTLATRGVATILFLSGTVCVVSGNVS